MAIPLFQGKIKPYEGSDADLVSNEAAAAALAKKPEAPGATPGLSGQTVHVIDENGKAFTVDASELPKVMKEGFHVESVEEKSAREYDAEHPIASTIQTGIRHLASGATLGFADPALKALNRTLNGEHAVDFEAQWAEQDKRHQLAALAGEGGGLALSTLLTGGLGSEINAGVKGATASALGEGIAGRTVSTIAGGAAEGAAFSTPKAVSEAIFENPNKAAETIMWGLGGGAAIGVLGAGYGEAKSGLKSMLTGLGETSTGGGAASKLREFSDSQLVKSMNPLKKFSKKIDGIGEAEVAAVIRKEGLAPRFGETLQETASKVEAATEKAGSNIGSFVSEVSGMAPIVPKDDIVNVIDGVLAKYSKGAEGVNAGSIRARLGGIKDDVAKMFPDGASLEDLVKIRRVVDDAIPEGEKSKALRGAMTQLRRDLEESFLSKADDAIKMGGGDAEEAIAKYKSLKSDYRALVTLADATRDNVARGIANRGHGLTDYIAGGVGSFLGHAVGGPVGAAAGALVGGKINQWARMYGNTYASEAAGHIANMLERGDGVGAAFGFLSAADQKITDIVPEMLNASATAFSPLTKDTMETGTNEHAALDFLHEDGKDKAAALNQLAGQITDLASNPAKMQQKLDELVRPYAESAPAVGDALAMKLTTVVGYLAKYAPKQSTVDADANPFLPRIEKPPPHAQMHDFARVLTGAVDPFSIVRRLGAGTLSRLDVETIQTLWPEMYASIKQQIVEYAASGQAKAQPYERRIKLDMFAGGGGKVEPSIQHMAYYQGAFAAAAQAGGGPSGPAPKGTKAIQPPDVQTNVQRIASK